MYQLPAMARYQKWLGTSHFFLVGSDVKLLNRSGSQKIAFDPRRERDTIALGCVRKPHTDLDKW